jgi:hypothetical protein
MCTFANCGPAWDTAQVYPQSDRFVASNKVGLKRNQKLQPLLEMRLRIGVSAATMPCNSRVLRIALPDAVSLYCSRVLVTHNISG